MKASPTAADPIVDRLREVYGVASDADLARRLATGSSTVNNWRVRGSVPYAQVVDAARETGTSLDWLLLGLGPRERGAAEDPAGYAVPPAEPTPGPSGGGDARLACLMEWWAHWWAGASEDDKVWAMVQMRRAFPEAAEWLRRRGF